MLKSFTKIQPKCKYKLNIRNRCERLGIPIKKKGNGWAIEENYVKILLYEMSYSDMYLKIYDWIEKFDEELKEYMYWEMFDMSYEELSKFLIRKELI